MADFWSRQKRRIGNAASNYAIDPLRSAGRGAMDMAGDAWDAISGASAAQKATNQQLQGYQQGMETARQGTKDAQGYLSPYNNPEDYQSLRSLVKGGVFQPKAGGFNPGQYQAPGQFQVGRYRAPPDFKPGSYQAPKGFDPGQFQGSNATTDNLGAYSLKGFDPSMPTQPQRQAATAENVNMFMDPGYQFRLDQGLKGVTNSAKTMDSGATLKALMGYGQNLASQEYGNAYNRFFDAENAKQGDFRDTRNFGADQLNDAYSRFSGDRGFNRGAFESDRSYGRGAYEDDRNFGRNTFTQDRAYGEDAFRDRRNTGRANYQDDRNFGFDQYRDARNFGRDVYTQDRGYGRGAYENDRNFDYDAQQDQYGRLSDLVGISRDAAGDQAKYAYQGGQDEAGFLTDMADIRAGGTLSKSKARRGLAGDLFEGGMRVADYFKPKTAGR